MDIIDLCLKGLTLLVLAVLFIGGIITRKPRVDRRDHE